jgi:hypothetical protein
MRGDGHAVGRHVRRRLWPILGAVAALGLTAALGALSQVPYEPSGAGRAVVRFAWRARSVRVEECRTLTSQEQENLPAHMRRAEVCEGTVLPYRLQVRVDGALRLDQLVKSAGARGDRPLFVFEELEVTPGPHHLEVAFEREGDAPSGDMQAGATPAQLALTQQIELAVNEVALVTYETTRRELVVRGHGTPVPR